MSFENFSSSGPLAFTREQAERIFSNQILPYILTKGEPPKDPAFIMVAGQQGSGKSTNLRQAEHELEGATMKINVDELYGWVPGFHELARRDPTLALNAAEAAGAEFFFEAAMDYAKLHRTNIVLECAHPLYGERFAEEFKALRYRRELHAVAVPHTKSWPAIFSRADRALRTQGSLGTNWVVAADRHDKCYAGWARAIFDAERNTSWNRVVVCRRNGQRTYDNRLLTTKGGETSWARPPFGLEAMLIERHNGVTAADIHANEESWHSVCNGPLRHADSHMTATPMERYRDENLAMMRSEERRFDLFAKPGTFSRELGQRWHAFVEHDLAFTRKVQGFPHSPEFEKRTFEYAASMRNVADKLSFDRELDTPPSSNERVGARSGGRRLSSANIARYSAVSAKLGASRMDEPRTNGRRRLEDRARDRTRGYSEF